MEVINLNFIPSGANPVAHASQFDEGRTTRFNLFDGSAVYTLDGTEIITVSVRKPDGHIVTESVTNTSSNYVEVVTTEQMTACAGDNLAQIKVEKGGDTIGFLNYILSVQKDPEDGGDPSASFIHDLEQQIADAVADQYDAADVIFDAAPTAGHGVGYAVTSEGVKNAIDGAIAGLTIPEELDDLQDVEITSPTAGQIIEYDDNDGKWKNVANPASTTNFGAPYDENTTYNVPSLVIYNNLLYKLNDGEDGTTGPWDPTKWTQTSVAELAQLIGSLSSLTTTNQDSLVDAVNDLVYQVGDTIDLATTVYGGRLSNSARAITFSIPLNKILNSDITGATINGDFIIYGASSNVNITNDSTVGSWDITLKDNCVTGVFTLNTATSLPNGTAISVMFTSGSSKYLEFTGV